MVGLTSCLLHTEPPRDSLRVAQVANGARGDTEVLLSERGAPGGRRYAAAALRTSSRISPISRALRAAKSGEVFTVHSRG